MLKLKTKWFNKWAGKNSIPDSSLLEALENLAGNLSTFNLGGGLYKVRTRRKGRGKSGGYRTIIAYKEMDKAIFIYGFSKNERDNLDKDELYSFKKLAKDLLQLSHDEYKRQEKLGNFFRLEE
ncbi:MAG: type II toxin-antitoxin system RelE/ParE family toxin [candidate division KSB1 bacterium]|nr:type II toxin-antitoxin system RelE/ParE family toxin [candidate division KSB1 bacterium]